MTVIDAVPLRQWLKDNNPALEDKLRVLVAAGAQLAAAHAGSSAQRDFKPDLVLVDRAGRVALTQVSPVTASPPDAEAGVQLAYLAPERLVGQLPDVRSDQFSFCVTCHEILGGGLPFGGEERAARSEAVLARTPDHPLPLGVPLRFRLAIARGLSADPAARFSSMRALLKAVAPAATSRGWLAAGVVAMLVAGLTAAVVLLHF